MSVLANLSISYESLPGEPSFYASPQLATPAVLESPQSPLSLPYVAQSVKPRSAMSNFEFSPSFSTRQAVHRTTVHKTKIASVTSSSSSVKVEPVSKPEIKQIHRPIEKSSSTSRGMFNDFERASLLSYMQRRQFS
jgi:hypothetical protein